MKKLILLSTMLLAFAFTTFAQTDNQPAPVATTELKKGKGRGDRAEKQGANIKKQLGLSDEQANKMKDSRAAFHGKLKAIKSDNGLSKDEKRTQMKEAAAAFDNENKSNLTPEQYAKYGEMKKNVKGKMMEKRKNKKGLKQENDDMELPDDGQ